MGAGAAVDERDLACIRGRHDHAQHHALQGKKYGWQNISAAISRITSFHRSVAPLLHSLARQGLRDAIPERIC